MSCTLLPAGWVYLSEGPRDCLVCRFVVLVIGTVVYGRGDDQHVESHVATLHSEQPHLRWRGTRSSPPPAPPPSPEFPPPQILLPLPNCLWQSCIHMCSNAMAVAFAVACMLLFDITLLIACVLLHVMQTLIAI